MRAREKYGGARMLDRYANRDKRALISRTFGTMHRTQLPTMDSHTSMCCIEVERKRKTGLEVWRGNHGVQASQLFERE
jgi:hypothetical protein